MPTRAGHAPSAAAELWAGVRRLFPLLLGVAPFGVIYGVAAVSRPPLGAGLSSAAAVAMSSLVFAGSAQFLLAQLTGEGAPALVLVATAALVNLRHLLYSASVAPHLVRLPRRWKGLLAYLLTDEAYAAVIGRLEAEAEREGGPAPHLHWFVLGAGLCLWGGWQVSTAAGVLLGRTLPETWRSNLAFALPLTFIAIVVPMIRSAPALAAAAVAGGVALLGSGWPYQLGLVAAALAGIAAGWLAGRRR
jgi:predicted branched-subunit amino acid permease